MVKDLEKIHIRIYTENFCYLIKMSDIDQYAWVKDNCRLGGAKRNATSKLGSTSLHPTYAIDFWA